MFILSSLVVVMATFISNSTAILTIAACFGYILSMDIFGFALQAKDKVFKENMPKPRTSEWKLKDIIIFVIMLVLTAVIAGVSSHFSSEASSEISDAFGILFVVLLVLLKILGDLQCVSIFFGLFRNPFYPASIESSREFKKRKKTLMYIGLLRQTLLFYGEYSCYLLHVELLDNNKNLLEKVITVKPVLSRPLIKRTPASVKTNFSSLIFCKLNLH